jgi:hypothetical protein
MPPLVGGKKDGFSPNAEEVRLVAKKTETAPVKKSKAERLQKPKWTRPALREVSGQVMAQPYIRFT